MAARGDCRLGPWIILLPGVCHAVDDDEFTHRRFPSHERGLERQELGGMRERRKAGCGRHRSGRPADIHDELARRQPPHFQELVQRLIDRLVGCAESMRVRGDQPVPLLRKLGEVWLDVRFDLGAQGLRDKEAEMFGVQAIDRGDARRGICVQRDQQGFRRGFVRHAATIASAKAARQGNGTCEGHRLHLLSFPLHKQFLALALAPLALGLFPQKRWRIASGILALKGCRMAYMLLPHTPSSRTDTRERRSYAHAGRRIWPC